MNIIQTYLNKHAITNLWKINPNPQKKFHHAIVIPAFSESELLINTLSSIDNNDVSILENTLVIVVVNNAEHSPIAIMRDNQHTLEMLKYTQYNFTLGVVDAASHGFVLPAKQAGVGLARKIGMDLVLRHLSYPENLIFCTDADTIVSKNYMHKVISYFDTTMAQAAVIGFRHLESSDKKHEDAIRQYETFLISTADKIQKTGSPYGYVSMGSTMVCTVKAYCAVGGMTKKKATEDFYFLQKLSKYSGVHTIPDILVYPSSRQISRVYLGTGFRMKQIQNGFDINNLYYSKKAFYLLEKWLNVGNNAWKIQLSLLKKKTTAIHPNLTGFLKQERIEDIWTNLQSNAPSKIHFSKQFHRWFDGLKTLRFLKHFTEIA